MTKMQKLVKTKHDLRCGFWLIICFSLILGSCTGNTVDDTIPEPGVESEPIVALPETFLQIADFGLGDANVSGMVKQEVLNWTDQPVTQYAAVLVDAIPFLTVQADLSGLQIFQTTALDENGGYVIGLPQQPAYDEPFQVMMLAVENQDCLIPGNQLTYCWDAELASIAFTDTSQSKIVDGQILVWTADDQQAFPNSIGADGTFFTNDDKLMPLEPGYTIIDLGTTPFTFDHQGDSELALYSNYDPSIRDLSELTYTEAFERIYNDMREGYVFNGFEGKEPDWDVVYELIYPLVQTAEENEDVNAWVSALNAYTQQFSDSHVSISGDVVDDWVEEKYSHGYIYYFDLLSNGDLIYTRGTTSDIEQERYNYYQMGYKLAEIYKTPIDELFNEFSPIFGSYSNPEMYYRAQTRDIPHIFSEKGFKFGFENFEGQIGVDMYKFADAYTITAEDDYVISYDPSVPISSYRAYPGVGIISIHTDGHDMQTTMRLFEETLEKFDAINVDTVIIDLRDSEETRFMNYAGYFSDEAIGLGEMDWQQYGESDGKLRTRPLVSYPQLKQYLFNKIAVLTGERCKDACEADVYALGQLPQTTIYGETSTFGSYTVVDPTSYTLPDQITFNYSTGFIRDGNNAYLIEGTGVPVDVVIEERLSTYLHDYDWRLSLLVDMLVYEDEMNTMPDSAPRPLLLSEEEVNNVIDEIDQRDIEYLSIDVYPALYQPMNYDYRVFVYDPGKLIVSKKWCTAVPDLTLYKGEELKIEFVIDGNHIGEEYFNTRIVDKGTYKCWVGLVVLDNWVSGKHTVEINTEIAGRFFSDDMHWYREGLYPEEYTVVVKESE